MLYYKYTYTCVYAYKTIFIGKTTLSQLHNNHMMYCYASSIQYIMVCSNVLYKPLLRTSCYIPTTKHTVIVY